MRGSLYRGLLRAINGEELFTLATVLDGSQSGNQMMVWPGGQTLGDLGAPRLNQRAALFAEKLLEGFEPKRKSFAHEGEKLDVFFDLHAPPPKLIIIGAVHVAIHLIHFAKRLGFRSIVIDPRTAFATPERFAHADELITQWPAEALEGIRLTEATCLAVLSHDLKIDLPALEIALASPARYIGALGSKKTHAKRVAALEESGHDEAAIARIHSPIGLDLGGRKAEEIALSVIAEVVAVGHGK